MFLPITKDLVDRYIVYTGLEQLRRTGNNWFAKCPYCKRLGKKTKERKFYILTGYILTAKGVWVYCHKCGTQKSFQDFLSEMCPSVLESLKAEVLIGRKLIDQPITEKQTKIELPKETVADVLSLLKKVREVPVALEYCQRRTLPECAIDGFYFNEHHMQFLFERHLLDKKPTQQSDPRIVIPFFNEKKELTHIQGRSIDPKNDLRYITSTIKEDAPKIWGLDRIDKDKTVYITEGVFDAVYLNNAIAFASAQADLDLLTAKGITDIVFCFDHDIETNENLVRTASKYLEHGAGLFFFPKSISVSYKDFNDLSRAGWTPEQINEMVIQNTSRGLPARVKLAMLGG